MSTLSHYEADRTRAPGKPLYLRLLSYVRPFVALILLATALSFLVSGGRYVRAYLMKPLFDDVLIPHTSLLTRSEPSSLL